MRRPSFTNIAFAFCSPCVYYTATCVKSKRNMILLYIAKEDGSHGYHTKPMGCTARSGSDDGSRWRVACHIPCTSHATCTA